MRPTDLAHTLLRDIIREGDTVIDATCGNGHDTQFLAECVGNAGKVIAFDIQEAAITSSQQRITDAGYQDRVDFHQTSHCDMADHAKPTSISAIMFNLGYLPGQDHQLTTEASETLIALQAAVTLLQPGGALSIICYPGHDAGAVEAKAVEAWMTAKTNNGWRVAKYALLGTKKPAPYLLIASKN